MGAANGVATIDAVVAQEGGGDLPAVMQQTHVALSRARRPAPMLGPPIEPRSPGDIPTIIGHS
eukprot:8940280-Pyramimonas_sp.AAC.1